VTLLLVVATLALTRRPPSPPLARGTPPPEVKSSVRILDDQQLLALFPGSSVALIGRAGEQRLMFLDAAEAPVASATKH
jgi:hypothetical protein